MSGKRAVEGCEAKSRMNGPDSVCEGEGNGVSVCRGSGGYGRGGSVGDGGKNFRVPLPHIGSVSVRVFLSG